MTKTENFFEILTDFDNNGKILLQYTKTRLKGSTFYLFFGARQKKTVNLSKKN